MHTELYIPLFQYLVYVAALTVHYELTSVNICLPACGKGKEIRSHDGAKSPLISPGCKISDTCPAECQHTCYALTTLGTTNKRRHRHWPQTSSQLCIVSCLSFVLMILDDVCIQYNELNKKIQSKTGPSNPRDSRGELPCAHTPRCPSGWKIESNGRLM